MPSLPRLGRRIGSAAAWVARAACSCLAALTPLLAGPVAADDQSSPLEAATDGIATAVALWLAEDEAAGLTALAGLARDGDDGARLLLALIDTTPALHGPWLARLARAERIALMRAPGGLSGRSWLHLADLPLAAAWRSLLHIDAGPETGAAFAALGEARAAREALTVLAAREHPSLSSDWADWMDPELVWLVWPRADDDLRAQLAAMVPPDHPQRALMGETSAPEALDAWLAASPAAAPLRGLCDRDCPDTAAACRRAAHAAIGSHSAVLTLGSPAETLIPADVFAASPRGRAMVLRRILLAADARGRRALIARTAEADACLGALLEAESERFRYRREGSVAD